MKVGIIGAGATGIVAAKLLQDAGFDYDVFESSESIGGTWIYTEDQYDKHGLPVRSSMYKNLKTNLPKELMTFEGLDYDLKGISFITREDVLNYLVKFTLKFNLASKIKFQHLVTEVSRKNDYWELTAKNLKEGKDEVFRYDSIFVCNGHYTTPSYPDIPGTETFPGPAIHSHHYKYPEVYKDKILVVIGIGPSAIDISYDIAPFAKRIYLSHHGPKEISRHFPSNVICTPDIKLIDRNEVKFIDESTAQVDCIMYCTGYNYDLPFLNENCGIHVDKDYVCPLYKQLISIPYPSMFFIGLPHRTFLFPLFEIQVKAAINILSGKAKLPNREEMLEDTILWERMLESRSVPKKRYHMISSYVKEYFTDIVNLGNVDPLPEVLFKIFEKSNMIRVQELPCYRNRVFEIIDSETYSFS